MSAIAILCVEIKIVATCDNAIKITLGSSTPSLIVLLIYYYYIVPTAVKYKTT